MGKLVVGPFNKGLRNDVTPFNVDNDSFPVLINSYQWRGRIKRKRGTRLYGRLERYFKSTSTSYNSGTTTITLNANADGNLLINSSWNLLTSGSTSSATIVTYGTLVPTTISITDTSNANEVYTDPLGDGVLSGSTGGTGTISYNTGEFTITGGAGHVINAHFVYYPEIPVMGIRDFIGSSSQFPNLIGFDPKYSYSISTTNSSVIYDVSFYKNPPTGTYTGYTEKSDVTPTSWNGQDYQQFWTVNYQGAMWATNGINMPFSSENVGMQFLSAAQISSATQTSATTVDFVIPSTPLVVGDFVFANEFTGTSGSTLNFQTGYVTAINGGTSTYTVKFPNANIGAAGLTPGILQYLTNRSDVTKDCLRWYDGDPTNQDPVAPILNGHKGWVNFMPPLSHLDFSIVDLPEDQYYLVGCRIIWPFKDRLLFFGPVIQSSTSGPFYLNDTVIYSQNGTPYYTCSFDGDPTLTTTTFHPILVPTNQTATASAYFEDITGFGGFISTAFDQDINTVAPNEDVLIVGFNSRQTRMLYTGNDIVPFNFFTINSELGSGSTFSAIILDKGILSKGSRGFVITSQVETQRIDTEIPDEVFEVSLVNNGTERVTAQRDYINEWIYFTYPSNQNNYRFPTQTLQYNYRSNTWSIFKECYTAYGTIRISNNLTWATVGEVYPTWSEWNVPWSAGASNALQPKVIGGNTDGFLLIRDDGTDEGASLPINNISPAAATITAATQANPCVLTANNSFVVGQTVMISGVVGMTQLNGNTYTILAVTPTTITINTNSSAFGAYVSGGTATSTNGAIFCPNHCLNTGDYIIINDCLGTIASEVNGKIFSIISVDANSFNTNPTMSSGFTYLGNGTVTRMYIPFIQTRQFPLAWSDGKKTRISAQQYLLTRTPKGQITLYIYLSQDADDPYDMGPVVPDDDSPNNALIYSTILPTSPELYIQDCVGIALGSVGDGSSLSYTFDYFQLFTLDSTVLVAGSVFIQIGTVATFTDNGSGGFTVTGTGNSVGSSIDYYTGIIVLAFTSAPTSETSVTNFEYYVTNIQSPTAQSQAQIWHRFNTSLLGDTVQIGFTMDDTQMRDTAFSSQFAEIELHGFILDVSPSGLLA